MSVGIQGRPMFSVGLRMGSALGSSIVGGTANRELSLAGRVGFTSTREENGGRFPGLAGRGFSSPPRPLLSEGSRLRRSRKRAEGSETVSLGVRFGGIVVLPPFGVCAKRNVSPVKTAMCVINEAL